MTTSQYHLVLPDDFFDEMTLTDYKLKLWKQSADAFRRRCEARKERENEGR